MLGCAPKPQPKAITPVPRAQFTITGTPHGTRDFDEMTVAEYALLNGRMSDLLERIGLKDSRGYLFPTTYGPTIVIEGDPDKKLAMRSTEDLVALCDHFFAECSKDLTVARASHMMPNQALVPTPASVTPAAGAPVAPDAGAAHL